MLEFDDVVAEPLGDGNDDLRRLRRALVAPGDEVLVALDAGLRFCLTCLRRRGDPLALAFERALARLFLAAFLQEALLLLSEPGRVIALVGDAAAAIELENPAGNVVEEVAVVRNDEDRA